MHALRAAGEIVAGVMAFAEEIGHALADDEDDVPEHIPVESDDDG